MRGPSNLSNVVASFVSDKLKKCSSLTELEHLYASLLKTRDTQDAFFTNAMIRGFVNGGRPCEGLQCYVDTLRMEISPTSYTFPPLMRACALLRDLGLGEALHGHVWRNGLNSHLFVQTSMVDFYSKLCRIGESVKVFDEMPDRDSFAWTTMISAYAHAGDMNSASMLFRDMPERNSATWNAVIDGFARSGDVESAELLFSQMPCRDLISWTILITCYSQRKMYREALAIFREMVVNGVNPDGVTMATVVSACAHLGALELGKEIHFYLMQNGFTLNVFIGSALIDMYAKCGDLNRSLLVFVKLRDKNLFCWNAMLEGLASHGYAEETLSMFSKMIRKNVEPNGVTFISVLSACTHAGLVEEGRARFFSMKNDYNIPPEVEHYGCLVDLLSKAGLLEEALDLIRSMEIEANAVIWGALLGGCKLHKNLKIGGIAINELKDLEPKNSGYYHLLLDMLAEEKRWGEVKTTWTTMKELGVEKRFPGSSWIELEKRIHQFSVSDRSHEASSEICFLLSGLNGHMKLAGYVPDLGCL